MQSAQQATATLDRLEAIRRRTLEPFHAMWYPLVVFGVITPGSATIDELASALTPVYWLIGGAAGWTAIARYYERRGRRLGVGRPVHLRRYLYVTYALWGAIFATSIAAAALDSPNVAIIGNSAIIGAAYVGLGRYARNRIVAAAGGAIIVTGAAVAAAGLSHPFTITALAIGSILSLSGLYLHAQQPNE
jgi:hypothetical protein